MEAKQPVNWNKGVFSLRELLLEGCHLTIKFNRFIEFDPNNYIQDISLNENHGSITLDSISKRQKFYSDSRMVLKSNKQERYQKLIKIRNFLFLDSELFIRTKKNMDLQCLRKGGLMNIEISNENYAIMLRQLKLRRKRRWLWKLVGVNKVSGLIQLD